jgi:SAM-dependent methyltransferase
MAREYPKSTFAGYDIAEDAIARGNAEAKEMGLPNARFEVLDVTKLPSEPRYDLITAFDAIHDQVDPATVLRRVSEALAPGGTFLMIDIKASSKVEENVGNPIAPFLYGISVMHCMTVSLAHDGAGLGTVWGEQVALRMLSEAGFTDVEVTDAPDPMNSIYVCWKLGTGH